MRRTRICRAETPTGTSGAVCASDPCVRRFATELRSSARSRGERHVLCARRRAVATDDRRVNIAQSFVVVVTSTFAISARPAIVFTISNIDYLFSRYAEEKLAGGHVEVDPSDICQTERTANAQRQLRPDWRSKCTSTSTRVWT